MKPLIVALIAAAVIVVRLGLRRRSSATRAPRPLPNRRDGSVRLVAGREIRERSRSRVFRIGTLIILAVVAAGIVIPVARKGHHPHEVVGVVGSLSAPLRASTVAAGAAVGVQLDLVDEASLAAAESDLRGGRLNLVVVDAQRLVVDRAISAGDASTSALVVREVADVISLQAGLERAGLPARQAAQLAHPVPLPVDSLRPAPAGSTSRVTALYGLILIFVLLSQYGTWIMMGVVEEKSSRVVEVLLSTLRPVQLLSGKVLGIGLLALAQAAAIVAVALGLAAVVGSDLVKGTAPLEVLTVLAWLVLGYAFYCWVYAAGGALADRQEHLQTMAFPLQLPILFGYVTSITALGTTDPSTLVRVLAYLPPTAPFAMTTLVADRAVTWWQFALSAAISVAATVGLARVAAVVYRRAVLRTGRRVRLRDVLAARTA